MEQVLGVNLVLSSFKSLADTVSNYILAVIAQTEKLYSLVNIDKKFVMRN